MSEIATFESRFGAVSRRAFALKNPSFSGDQTPPAEGVALGVRAVARVNGGRWIADCPTPDCNGAEYVSFTDPVLFCHGCRNAAVDHLLIPVDVPSEKTRTQVETYLLARPVPETRNWDPSEPVTKLRDENRERGLRLT